MPFLSFFFFCLVHVGSSDSMLNRNGKGEVFLFLVLDLRGQRFQLFTIVMMLFMSLSHGLYHVEMYSFHNEFFKNFYDDRVLNFVKYFFCILGVEIIIIILSFIQLILCIIILFFLLNDKRP
jgi:hypothetical protein